MVLSDDDEANDTSGWIALALTGIGFVPLFGSAIKGVGKVIIENARESLAPALAVMRKLGKGDPVSYLRKIDWADLTKQASDLIKEKIVGIRDALLSILSSKATWLLSDAAEKSLKKNADQLTAILPKIEQGLKEGMQNLEKRMNKALDEYTGEMPHSGVTNVPKKTKTDELNAPKGNELTGAKAKQLDTPARQTPDDFTEFKSMNHKRAAAGEYNAHQLMTEKGYTPVGKTDGKYKPGETGIDGVYNHPNPPPYFTFTEAKYNTARLGNTKTGKQMSNDWVTDKRLQKAGLNERERRKILKGLEKGNDTVEKLLIRNKPDGSLIVKTLDKNAKIIGETANF